MFVNKILKIFLVVIIVVSFADNCYSQSDDNESVSAYRIMFYNVENYFDAKYDSLLSYNEFTPSGDLHWTNNKYVKKRNSIYKVIKAVGGWNPIALIGLVEVENYEVLADLVNNTPLKNDGYDIIHYESNDFRGIDVGLIYHKASFKPIHSEKVVIKDPENPQFTTRDMLYVVGLLGGDTLHVVVNHWTSRYRGYLQSEPLRILAAQRLISLNDSICLSNPNANVILMGDFNDNPDNKSMQLLTSRSSCKLRNMILKSSNPNVHGTLKYKTNWFSFDQILVSNSILLNLNKIKCDSVAHIFDANFLLVRDNKHFGLKTNRTNIGFKYNGGISDHLPIFLDVFCKN